MQRLAETQKDIDKDVRTFHKAHAQMKAAEAVLERAKERFKERAGGVDMVFRYRDQEVVVSRGEHNRLNNDKVIAAIGEKRFEECKVKTQVIKVSCRTARPDLEDKPAPRRRKVVA